MNGPPLMLYCAPGLTLIGAAEVMLVIVMGLDVCTTPTLAPVTGVKSPCGGGAAPVVTVKVELTPPIVAMADDAVLYVEAAVICTTT